MDSEVDGNESIQQGGDNDNSATRFQTRWLELRKQLGDKAVLRPEPETKAMSWWSRQKIHVKALSKRLEGAPSPSQQYRIPPMTHDMNVWGMLMERRTRRRNRLTSLAPFHALLLYFIVIYVINILIFALCLQLYTRLHYDRGSYECVTSYDYSNVSIRDTENFLVLFSLSWTTFSTVGYGVIGISVDSGCQAIRYFLAFEAFAGIMFSGYSGALIFASISGLLGRAHVTFSSCICVQFGDRLSGPRVNIENNQRIMTNEGISTAGGCPVLVMRLVNESENAAIVGARLECFAVMSETISAEETLEQDRITYQINDGIRSSQHVRDAKVETCEKVNIAPSNLPYFKEGSWYFNHVLNQNSPLLKDSVRGMIRQQGGKWPTGLNDYGKIRSSFSDKLEYIAVVVNGTSVLTSTRIFKTITYTKEDMFIGYKFVELAYISPSDKSHHSILSRIRYDDSLINDITPQVGGGSEPLGSRVPQSADDSTASRQAASSVSNPQIDRRYLWRGNRRRNFDHLMRPHEEAMPMNPFRRKCTSLGVNFRRRFRNRSYSEDESCQQYAIPPAERTRNLFGCILTKNPLITFTLWLYKTKQLYAILAFLLGYFVWIWVFGILIWVVDPACLSGWQDVPGGFFASFYVPFQISWCTFSTVGFGGVAPLPAEPCRGLNLILALEAFIGLVYSSFCGAIFFAKVSRNESIANVSFSSAVCLQYKGNVTEKHDSSSTKDLETNPEIEHEVSFPFLEMRALNEDAQFPRMKGQILNASVKCFATSFELKHDSGDVSNISFEHDSGALLHHSFDPNSNIHWKQVLDEIELVPNRQAMFSKVPWSFRHVLDASSPLLKKEVRERIRNYGGGWPSDLDSHEKIRCCLSNDLNSIQLIFKGTSNRTANEVYGAHQYKPADIFVGWKFAGMGYVAKGTSGDKEYEVKFDPCLLNDILEQTGGGAEPLFQGEKEGEVDQET